jgi:hypothetical protein
MVDKKFEKLKKLAEEGSAKAQYKLGLLYDTYGAFDKAVIW